MEDNEPQDAAADVGSPEDIRTLLAQIRQDLSKTKKATVSEYIRLLELLREVESRSEAEVRVGWYDSLKDE
jgi:hypothetical protein